MPKYKKELTNYHIERVRQVLVMNPNMGVIRISKTLAEARSSPIKLDPQYISNLKKKIIGERTWRYEKAKVKRRIALLEDQTRELQSGLWEIVNNTAEENKIRIQAANAIVASEHKLFQAQMDSGIYERKIGTIEVEEMRDRAVGEEAVDMMVGAFRAWGLVEKEPEPKNIIDVKPIKKDEHKKTKTNKTSNKRNARASSNKLPVKKRA